MPEKEKLREILLLAHRIQLKKWQEYEFTKDNITTHMVIKHTGKEYVSVHHLHPVISMICANANALGLGHNWQSEYALNHQGQIFYKVTCPLFDAYCLIVQRHIHALE